MPLLIDLSLAFDFMISTVSVVFSNVTCLAFLSSLNPLKEGCLRAPSFVDARKLISATICGFTQVTSALGGFGLNLEGLLYSGTSLKGHFAVFKGDNLSRISCCIF